VILHYNLQVLQIGLSGAPANVRVRLPLRY